MSEVFISYARSTAAQANAAADALRGLGYSVWMDDELLAHHAYTHAIEEQLTAAKAALVIWSAEAVKSEWVLSEANRAREDHKLVQLTVDGARLPMPFDQTQCADLAGWSGDANAAGWRKVVASIGELVGDEARDPSPPSPAPKVSLPDQPSIAVLAFVDPAGASEGDYFADGMVEEIVRALTRIPSLFVIAGRSGLAYRGDKRSPREIAAELGVRYLLDGSVRRSGKRLRIAVNLADAIGGAQIWADRFDGDMEDVFDLQEQVADGVASRIAPSIRAADARRAASRPTSDLTAYDLYLRALHRETRFDDEMPAETMVLLDQALALDPDYALALALKSLTHSVNYLWIPSGNEAYEREAALKAGRKALAAGPDEPEVVGIVSNVLLWTLDDVAAAVALARRAVETNPGEAFAWWARANVELFTGQPETAMECWARHLRLDPRSVYRPFITGSTALALAMLQRFGEVEAPAREAMQLVPNHPFAALGLAAMFGHAGRAEEARTVFGTIRPGLGARVLQIIQDSEHRDLIASGLRLAGLNV